MGNKKEKAKPVGKEKPSHAMQKHVLKSKRMESLLGKVFHNQLCFAFLVSFCFLAIKEINLLFVAVCSFLRLHEKALHSRKAFWTDRAQDQMVPIPSECAILLGFGILGMMWISEHEQTLV